MTPEERVLLREMLLMHAVSFITLGQQLHLRPTVTVQSATQRFEVTREDYQLIKAQLTLLGKL